MSGARNMMNITEAISITDEEKLTAIALLESSPSISVSEAIEKYKLTIDSYCSEFNEES